jgi:DNA replication and repair protein RecF
VSGGGSVWLRDISIRDFRNLALVNLNIPERGFALVGDNGHGKTNFLEAVYYLQLLRSIRGARDAELVRFGAEGFHIAGHAVVNGERSIAIGYEKSGKRKRVAIDGVVTNRISDSLGSLPSLMFSPRDLELIAGTPSERRRYLDVILAVTSRRYLSALQRYRATLVRRNAALREISRRGASNRDDAEAAVWEPALAEHGAILCAERRAWIAEHHAKFAELMRQIGSEEPARLVYVVSAGEEGDSEAQLLKGLERHRAGDIRRGMTQCGPHRDDLEITLGGRDIRVYGSAGEQRTAAIALRMLEAETLRNKFQLNPLLLLDDPFAELDEKRSARILDLLMQQGRGQIILAVPRDSDIPGELMPLQKHRIVNGEFLDAA